jgi:hypothetical protein
VPFIGHTATGVGEGVGDGVGLGDGLGEGDGDGLGEGDGDGLGVGSGVALMATRVAPRARATMRRPPSAIRAARDRGIRIGAQC